MEKVIANTPNGGVYFIAFYYDKNGNPTDRENAESIHIHEYDKEDNFICETVLIKNIKKEENEKRKIM